MTDSFSFPSWLFGVPAASPSKSLLVKLTGMCHRWPLQSQLAVREEGKERGREEGGSAAAAARQQLHTTLPSSPDPRLVLVRAASAEFEARVAVTGGGGREDSRDDSPFDSPRLGGRCLLLPPRPSYRDTQTSQYQATGTKQLTACGAAPRHTLAGGGWTGDVRPGRHGAAHAHTPARTNRRFFPSWYSFTTQTFPRSKSRLKGCS